MIWLLITISILLPVLILLFWLFWRYRIGCAIGTHLMVFENCYDEVFQKTGLRDYSLRHAFSVFRDCPRLNRLKAQDIEKLVIILGPLENPKSVVHKLIMELDSSKIVDAFRDEQLLKEIVQLEEKKSTQDRKSE